MPKSFASPKPLTGQKVCLVLVAFFGVVIGANMTMMRFAVSTLPGTEVDSAYSASLGYGKEIAASHDQGARNWKVTAHVQRIAGGGITLQVEARDDMGKPISGLRFQGRFERPTDRRADQSLEVADMGAGVYRGTLPLLASGQWDLVIEGLAGERRMFLSKNRMFLD